MSSNVLDLLLGKENKPPQTGFSPSLMCRINFYQLEPKNGTFCNSYEFPDFVHK